MRTMFRNLYQQMADHFGFKSIESRIYYQGKGVRSPDGRDIDYPGEFIVTAHDGRKLHFITPVEWEQAKGYTFTQRLVDALMAREVTYRPKSQREYILTMLAQCRDQLAARV